MNKRINLAILALCLIGLTGACATSGRDANITPPPGVDVVLSPQDNVTANPSAFINRTVMVEGTVRELLSGNAFVLEYGPMFRKKQLLVIEPDRDQIQVIKDGQVRVVGDVELFNARQMEVSHNIRLDESIFGGFQNQAVIVASNVQTQ